jgi:lysophospholipid acyltransferase (LPLAT)-like uncharacterized protein
VTKPKPKPKSGVVVPKEANLPGRIAARLIWLLISFIAATLRWRWKDESGAFETEPEKPVIFCVWHNRLGLALVLYRNHVRRRWPHRRMACLVSASRDGGMLARVMELFHAQPIRGSSSRRGAQALREATTAVRNNLDLSITPDGPRGPRYELQPGIISVAQITGCKVIPVSYRVSWKVTLKSWDQFQIPLPFAKCEVHLDKAIDIPRKLSPEALETTRADLESVMRRITNDD